MYTKNTFAFCRLLLTVRKCKKRKEGRRRGEKESEKRN